MDKFLWRWGIIRCDFFNDKMQIADYWIYLFITGHMPIILNNDYKYDSNYNINIDDS